MCFNEKEQYKQDHEEKEQHEVGTQRTTKSVNILNGSEFPKDLSKQC